MSLNSLNLNADRRTLRLFGLTGVAGFGLLGWWCLWKGGLFGLDFGAAGRPVGFGLLALSAYCGICSALWPTGNRPVFVGLTLLAFPIGWVISNVLLVLLFFGLMTPLGVIRRALGWDPLCRKFDRDASTYWVERSGPVPPERYFRQY